MKKKNGENNSIMVVKFGQTLEYIISTLQYEYFIIY